MQFNSWIFLFLFLPVVLTGYFFANKFLSKKIAAYYLIMGNLTFYSYLNLNAGLYFLFIILINYFFFFFLIQNNKKMFLILGLVFNLGMLGVLKYYNFFISSINDLFQTDFHLITFFLPMGMSFFTFQFIALLYDCYKGNITSISFTKYTLFSTLFTKVIQGPIMLYQDFDKQYDLDTRDKFNSENFAKGLYMLTLGFGKKILIADVLAQFTNPGFSQNYQSYNSTMLILLMLLYTFQIYFDFSAYTDMARGISFMLNIELPRNFDSPYKAVSVNSFWKRWHMSLTNFFTRYLYIPLGGNRKGEYFTYLNVIIVYLLSGLWHGANYTFILWGLFHGIASFPIDKKLLIQHIIES